MEKQLTKKYVRAKMQAIDRAINKLDDAYTLADFQRKVFSLTGYVVKPNENEKFVTLHKPFHINVLKDQMYKDGLYWGISGGYIKTPIAMVDIKGHYSEKSMCAVLSAVDRIKKSNIKSKT